MFIVGVDEPVGMLNSVAQIQHSAVGRAEPQAQVGGRRVPVPGRVGDRARPQLVDAGQAVRAGQPRHVGLFDVVGGRIPLVARHFNLSGPRLSALGHAEDALGDDVALDERRAAGDGRAASLVRQAQPALAVGR